MEKNDEFDMDFDEDFLKTVDDEEELYYTQKESIQTDLPSAKRRKLDLFPPPTPPVALQSISSRKNHLLDIFSTKPCTETSPNPHQDAIISKNPPRPSEPLKKPSEPTKTPKIPWKPSGKASALSVFHESSQEIQNLPKTTGQGLPKRFPKTSPTEKILEPRRFQPNVASTDKLHSKTLVRKFPGPAGLIPDDLDPSQPTDNLNYLRMIDESDAKTSPEKIQPDFCTQETKKIFLEGAWRNMVSDLPRNFLAGYDVNSIKESDATKVPFLGVVIQQIDQGSENPRVRLKDISGSIDGIIHKDLALDHPNILHSSVVLLLQNVGVLSIKKTSFVKSKVIVISIDSLIAAYSEKGILVRTPFLENIKKGEESFDKLATQSQDLKKSIDASKSSLDRSKQAVDTVTKRIVPKKSIDILEKSNDVATESINKLGPSIDVSKEATYRLMEPSGELKELHEKDRRKSTENMADDFSNADFNFEDDVFNQIDMTQFDESNAEENIGINVIETVTVVKSRREEETMNDGTSPITGFADDLLNASDSDDEYLSQLDIDALSKHPSLNR